MRKLMILTIAILALAGCAREEVPAGTDAEPQIEEKTYDLEGVIVSRDPATNQLTVDHEEIPGYMAAMTMSYEVRGQNVAELPADGSAITAVVHATEEAYWLTDVNPAPGAMPTGTDTTGTTDTAGTTTM
ncbi:MAG: copper-binding protein [Thermoanaerobaculia bacterium]